MELHFREVGHRSHGCFAWPWPALGSQRMFDVESSVSLGTIELHGVSYTHHEIAGSSERPLSPASPQEQHCGGHVERKVGLGTFLEPDRHYNEGVRAACSRDPKSRLTGRHR